MSKNVRMLVGELKAVWCEGFGNTYHHEHRKSTTNARKDCSAVHSEICINATSFMKSRKQAQA